VFKTNTRELVASFRVTNGSASSSTIRQIEFARRGTSFLVSTADRIIRVYDAVDILPSATTGKTPLAHGDPEPLQKLQDLVNKTLWKKCCFSGDGEYICAGSSRQHSLYIWEKNNGNLVKILHGTKGEMLLDVVWHPVRPLIASVASGVVSIWSQNQVENWSAFAPDFKELDENVEYEERESEFDVDDEDKSVHASKGKEDEEIEVDVIKVQPIQAFLSSDEEDESNQLLFLTITPEFDEVDDNLIAPAPSTVIKEAQTRGEEQNSSKNANKSETIVYNIDLPNAPTNEIHPLLSKKYTNN
jgi:COMPASS component SWD1